jgi:predicted nucleotidyltransferase component of viral defense system
VDGIKVDIVNYVYKWIDPVIEIERIKMAGLKDIAAMKLLAITNRGTKKDFIDLYVLLQHFSLPQILGFFEQKYPNHSIYNVIRSISYFVDAEDNPMPNMFIPDQWNDMKSVIRSHIEQLSME